MFFLINVKNKTKKIFSSKSDPRPISNFFVFENFSFFDENTVVVLFLMLIKNNIFINYLETFFLIASLLRGNESLKTIHSNIESNMGMLAKAFGLVEKDLI